MRHILLTVVILFSFQVICSKTVTAQQHDKQQIEKSHVFLIERQQFIESDLKKLDKELKQKTIVINDLIRENRFFSSSLDSLKKAHKTLESNQAKNNVEVNEQIRTTKSLVKDNQATLNFRTFWGVAIAALIVISVSVILYRLVRRIKSGTSTIDEVRKAQETLQDVQKKMQEEAVKLDGKLIEIIEKQLKVSNATKVDEKKPDHSLALKVADEIVRIKTNLMRMDASVKGHKQLSKAVERIEANFLANGYEIVDMLGKPYYEGMKCVASFVIDETLPEGSQKITRVIKPQINYNDVMIQAAQIEVSQNI